MTTLKLVAFFDRRPQFCHIKATGAGVEVSVYPNGSCFWPVSANVPKEVLDQVQAVSSHFWLFFENIKAATP